MYMEQHRKVTYVLQSEMNAAIENKTRLEIHVNQVRKDVIPHIAACGLRCAVARRALCVTLRVTCVAEPVFVP